MSALFHRVDGSGESAIVLLNGGMMTTAHWEPVAARLVALGHRVVRLDLRGQMMSPGQAAPDLAAHADDVAALLCELGIARAAVAGTSFGALVGLVLAANHPQQVSALVAMNATARLSSEMLDATRELEGFAREAAAGTGDPGRILDVLVPGTYSDAWIEANRDALPPRRAQMKALPAAYYEGMATLLDALARLDLTEVLPRIAVPVHVVAAELDRTFPLPFSQELAAAIPGARLTVIAGAPHGFIIEQPDAAARLIHAFAEEHAAVKPAAVKPV